MIKVKAPDGYEAIRQWRDGAREWEVAARRVGDTFWTLLGGIGHAHLTDEELDKRAAMRVVCPRLGIAVRMPGVDDRRIVAECWTCWYPGRCLCKDDIQHADKCAGRPHVPEMLTEAAEPFHRDRLHDVRPVKDSEQTVTS